MRTIKGRAHLVGPLLVILAGCAPAVKAPAPDLVWPLPPEAPRIRYVDALSRSDHFKTGGRNWLKEVVLGEDDAATARMVKPYAVTTDDRSRIYVTDTGLSRVWVFDREKKQVRFIGDSGQGQLVTPGGVAVDARGVVFVADAKQRRVFGYDESGKLVLAIGQPDEFYSPSGLAIDRDTNRLYVSDTGRHKIRVYDAGVGTFLFEFGGRGTAPGQFNYPTHLFLKGRTLYVTDTMNFRVQALRLDGTFIRKYGEIGANFGQVARPKGVAVDSEGHVYVADAAFGNFQIFNADAELLLFVGRTGFTAGEFYLPAGLFIDQEDRIYAVDQYNRRVQVFQYMGEVYLAKAKLANAGQVNGREQ